MTVEEVIAELEREGDERVPLCGELDSPLDEHAALPPDGEG